MLSKSAVSAAWPLADQLAARGFILGVAQDSPLQQLTASSLTVASVEDAMGQPVTGQALAETLATPVANDATSPADQMQLEHERMMQETCAAVSNAIAVNLHVARNVAVPLIASVHDAATAALSEFSGLNHAPYVITTKTYAPLWDSPVLQSMVAKYADVAPLDIDRKALNLPSPSDWTEVLRTGAVSFDDEVAQFASAMGNERLAAVWTALFNCSGPAREALRTDRQNYDDSLIGFLFLTRLQADIPEGVNMDLAEYRAYIAELLAEAAKAINWVLQRRMRDMKMQFLVYSTVPKGEGAEIFVNGDIYGQWLEAGGTPETLLAAAALNANLGYRELLANKDALTAEWSRLYATFVAAAQANAYKAAITAIRSKVAKEIADGDESQQAFSKPEMHERLEKEIGEGSAAILEDLYTYCRHVVCQVFFPHMDVESVLKEIDALGRQQPDITPPEAAYHAVIRHVTRWLAAQFQVTDAPGFVRPAQLP